ncbi:translation initiation factor IF-2-like [Chiroxiphia lanceolata]|uniref:translation initiation factor IF-2-like n=1 Tax=Chiroxiphia lanceolata TaxID=296741 RepID=UPI0013CF26CF|nr:translation initiation factor IF-2-like [Chiroxiphia lanceolata]
MWMNLSRFLGRLTPPVAWDFTSEQVFNPNKLTRRLMEGCLAYPDQNQQLLTLYWGLACAYQAAVQYSKKTMTEPGKADRSSQAAPPPPPVGGQRQAGPGLSAPSPKQAAVAPAKGWPGPGPRPGPQRQAPRARPTNSLCWNRSCRLSLVGWAGAAPPPPHHGRERLGRETWGCRGLGQGGRVAPQPPGSPHEKPMMEQMGAWEKTVTRGRPSMQWAPAGDLWPVERGAQAGAGYSQMTMTNANTR